MALRAGSVGLGREAGLGARRGWTRRRRPPPISFPGPPPPRLPPPSLLHPPPRFSAGGAGWSGRGGDGVRRGSRTTLEGPAAAATLDASRALPVDRPSCGGRRGRTRGARRAPARPGSLPPAFPPPPPPPPLRPGGRCAVVSVCVCGGSGRGASVRAPVFPRRVRPPGRGFSRAAPRLGRRLAADLELVRTRGIRLFN